MTFSSLLYFGAWHDILPLTYFKNVNTFIFIDTQPRSEWDENVFDAKEYRFNFYNDLKKIYKSIGFEETECIALDDNYYNTLLNIPQSIYYSIFDIPKFVNPHLCYFYNKTTNQIIKYYLSCNILFNDNIYLNSDIHKAEALYIAGYIPNIILIKKFNLPKIFIGNYNTIYKNDEHNLCEILEHPKCFCYFYKWYYFDEINLVSCKNYPDFKIKVNGGVF